MQVVRIFIGLVSMEVSGGRVSNAWVTYHRNGDSLEKSRVIPNKAERRKA